MQIPDLNGRGRPRLHGEAGADLNRQNMRKQRFTKQICEIRMFLELRKLQRNGAIRGYRKLLREIQTSQKRQNVRKE